LGAETRLARADDSVAEKIPAVMRGPNADTISIAWGRENTTTAVAHSISNQHRLAVGYYT